MELFNSRCKDIMLSAIKDIESSIENIKKKKLLINDIDKQLQEVSFIRDRLKFSNRIHLIDINNFMNLIKRLNDLEEERKDFLNKQLIKTKIPKTDKPETNLLQWQKRIQHLKEDIQNKDDSCSLDHELKDNSLRN